MRGLGTCASCECSNASRFGDPDREPAALPDRTAHSGGPTARRRRLHARRDRLTSAGRARARTQEEAARILGVDPSTSGASGSSGSLRRSGRLRERKGEPNRLPRRIGFDADLRRAVRSRAMKSSRPRSQERRARESTSRRLPVGTPPARPDHRPGSRSARDRSRLLRVPRRRHRSGCGGSRSRAGSRTRSLCGRDRRAPGRRPVPPRSAASHPAGPRFPLRAGALRTSDSISAGAAPQLGRPD
jgi:hypothetical protein